MVSASFSKQVLNFIFTQGGFIFMPRNLLQQYFPMIRTRFEIQQIIRSNPKLNNTFMSWKPEQQKEFIDFCTGERGVKILYDSFFKEVFNAEYAPQRLESLLTLIS